VIYKLIVPDSIINVWKNIELKGLEFSWDLLARDPVNMRHLLLCWFQVGWKMSPDRNGIPSMSLLAEVKKRAKN
jgi:hypothetical protein